MIPINPNSQKVHLIGKSQCISKQGAVGSQVCLLNCLAYEKLEKQSFFQAGTLIAYDLNLNRWDTFFNWHIWGFSKNRLIDFSLGDLEEISQELDFRFVNKASQLTYSVVPFEKRQLVWDGLAGKGDNNREFFGADLIYVPGAIPSTVSVAPGILPSALIYLTQKYGSLSRLNQIVEALEKRLSLYDSETSQVYSLCLQIRKAPTS